MNEVTITHCTSDDGTSTWTEYRCGTVCLAVADDGNYLDSGEYTVDELRDLAAVLAHPDLQKLMHPAGSPEAARAAVVAALDNPNRMPTASEMLDLISHDQLSSYVFHRTVEWVLHRIANGYMPRSRGPHSAQHAARFDTAIERLIKPWRGKWCYAPWHVAQWLNQIEPMEHERTQQSVPVSK